PDARPARREICCAPAPKGGARKWNPRHSYPYAHLPKSPPIPLPMLSTAPPTPLAAPSAAPPTALPTPLTAPVTPPDSCAALAASLAQPPDPEAPSLPVLIS